jgi:hypothetical protein
MRKLLIMCAVIGTASAPALAQTTPPPAEQAPVAKQKTIKKVVCKRVEEDQETGSRLGSTSKICKTIEVPDPSNTEKEAQRAPEGQTPQAR